MSDMIGVDLAKNVFQLHGASMTGDVKYRKKLSRGQFFRFMSEQSPALVVMEACGSAHYWARELVKLGHAVKLVAPQYVRPFVKEWRGEHYLTNPQVLKMRRNARDRPGCRPFRAKFLRIISELVEPGEQARIVFPR
jgi:transposase